MKKTLVGVGFPVLCVLIVCVSFMSCSSAEYVDAEEFLHLSEEISQIHSIRSTEFIGATDSRVYLEQWRTQILLGSTYTVYWTNVSDLPDEISSALKSGINPWSSSAPLDN